MLTRPGESATRIAKFGLNTTRHKHTTHVECSANEKHEHEKARRRNRVGVGRGSVGGVGDEPGCDEFACGGTSSRRTRHSNCGGDASGFALAEFHRLPRGRQKVL